MAKFLFGLLLVALAATTGISMFGAALNLRLWMLYRRAGDRKKAGTRLALVVTMAGFSIMSIIIMIALLQAGTTTPSIYSWGYLFGLVVSGAGLTRLMKDTVMELVEREIQTGKEEGRGF